MNVEMNKAMILLLFLFFWLCFGVSHFSQEISDELTPLQLPPLWNEAPGELSDFPIVGNVTIIDAWDYRQRLGIYKVMVRATAKYMAGFGPGNTGNILWGLPIQHGWQFITQRLRDFSNTTRCGFGNRCISEHSWWASMNYFLSVIPFLGSINAGLFSWWPHEIHFIESRSGRYCTSVRSCSDLEALQKWTDFFQVVIRSNGKDAEGLPTNTDKGQMGTTEDIMLKYMWEAHISSIDAGWNHSMEPLPMMSNPEQQFGQGWASIVEFIAATHFQANFNQTNILQHLLLPFRILWANDRPPHIPDLDHNVNYAIRIMELFRNVNSASSGWLLRAWKRAMCSAQGRKEGRYLLHNLIQHPAKVPLALGRLLWDVVFFPCDHS